MTERNKGILAMTAIVVFLVLWASLNALQIAAWIKIIFGATP